MLLSTASKVTLNSFSACANETSKFCSANDFATPLFISSAVTFLSNNLRVAVNLYGGSSAVGLDSILHLPALDPIDFTYFESEFMYHTLLYSDLEDSLLKSNVVISPPLGVFNPTS